MNVRSSAGQVTGKVVADLKAPRQSVAGTLSVRHLDLAPILNDAATEERHHGRCTLDLHGEGVVGHRFARAARCPSTRRASSPPAMPPIGSRRRRASTGAGSRIDGRAAAYGATATTPEGSYCQRNCIGAGGVRLARPGAPRRPAAAAAVAERSRGSDRRQRRLPRRGNRKSDRTGRCGIRLERGPRDRRTGSGSRTGLAGLRRSAFEPSTIAGAAIAGGSTAGFTINGRAIAYQADATVANLDLQRVGTEFRVPALADRSLQELHQRPHRRERQRERRRIEPGEMT